MRRHPVLLLITLLPSVAHAEDSPPASQRFQSKRWSMDLDIFQAEDSGIGFSFWMPPSYEEDAKSQRLGLSFGFVDFPQYVQGQHLKGTDGYLGLGGRIEHPISGNFFQTTSVFLRYREQSFHAAGEKIFKNFVSLNVHYGLTMRTTFDPNDSPFFEFYGRGLRDGYVDFGVGWQLLYPLRGGFADKSDPSIRLVRAYPFIALGGDF